ncbi:MAG: GNAT family N-acetyltransferase [Winogradskyella sp.]|nr:GNAT family N-acetyltransferase [Winogradskyella sp.]
MRFSVGNIDLESERLIYKRVSTEHVSETYVNWINDSEVNMYLETRGNYTLDLLKTYVDEQYRREVYFWAIHLKDSKKHIGNIKIDPIDKDANSGEYGILMGDKTNWGKGYAKEASFRIIKYCFEELKLSKVTLGVIEDNISAVMLYKKMGFAIDEVKTKVGTYNNKTSNALRMSLHV